jgi:hypothetical protein
MTRPPSSMKIAYVSFRNFSALMNACALSDFSSYSMERSGGAAFADFPGAGKRFG